MSRRSIPVLTDILPLVPLLLFAFFCANCNKLVQVPNPISSVTSNQVFSSDATATSALFGIYSHMSSSGSPTFSNAMTTIHLGESADELTDEFSGSELYDLFLSNSLATQLSSGTVLGDIWEPAYFDIYSANAVISGVQSSTSLSNATASELVGEAKFIRAFCYFYLTNIFGAVPLVLTPDFNQTVLLPRASASQIYQQIASDLLAAQSVLKSDFSLSGGMPIRANKWAATALLARVYQYQGLWQSADSAATAVINSGQFNLVALPQVPSNGGPTSDSDVFAANSPESILQLQTGSNYPSPYANWEGYWISPIYNRGYWLTQQLLGSFEPGDLRRSDWVDSTTSNGQYIYFPYKYQVELSPGNIVENYTLLRLAEQYLIRAEAEANGQVGGPSAAVQDLNLIRGRAGLPPLSSSLTGDSVMTAIRQEYRIEFFSEWGHRWLDLKRWNIILPALDTISYKKGNIDSSQLLYPIPISEIQTDPNLTQNPGYSGY